MGNEQALEEHPDLIRKFIGQRNGIYALFKSEKLYYTGLASDLRRRLKSHVKDHHRGAWDSMSVYLTIGDVHLRELESLLIRVAQPPGNKQRGRLSGAENLDRKFERELDAKHRIAKDHLLGRPFKVAKNSQEPKRTRSIRARRNGKLYKARMRPDGSVRYNGTIFPSLSAAAKDICKHQVNGRWFWHIERSPGDWISIREYEG